MGDTAGAIAGGDLSHRVDRDRPAHRGRAGSGSRSTRCSTGSRRPSPSAQASEDRLRAVPRRRLARAAHAAGLDPRLRRAVPHRRRARARRARSKAMRRIEDEADAHGRPRRGPAHARAPRRGRATRRTRTSTSPRSRATRVDDARATAPDRADRRSPPTGAARVLGDATSCARCSPTSCATRSSTRRPGTPIEVSVAPRATGEVALEVRDHGPGPADRRPRRAVRALLARRGRPRARHGRAPGSAWRSSPAIVDAHGGGVSAATLPTGGASFVVRLPAGAALVTASSQRALTWLGRGARTLTG